MKHLKIVVNEIICKDPQDPKYDELYFVVATNNKSNVSKTIRKIGRSTVEPDLVIFDDDVDERSPILITGVEQRIIKDNSKVAGLMERLAAQGLDFASGWLMNNTSSTDKWKLIGDFLLENLISLVKLVFRDSPLITKVITEPYKNDVEYPITYVMRGKSDMRPTYDYRIEFDLKYF